MSEEERYKGIIKSVKHNDDNNKNEEKTKYKEFEKECCNFAFKVHLDFLKKESVWLCMHKISPESVNLRHKELYENIVLNLFKCNKRNCIHMRILRRLNDLHEKLMG